MGYSFKSIFGILIAVRKVCSYHIKYYSLCFILYKNKSSCLYGLWINDYFNRYIFCDGFKFLEMPTLSSLSAFKEYK